VGPWLQDAPLKTKIIATSYLGGEFSDPRQSVHFKACMGSAVVQVAWDV
jgi:hypothetical protein